MSTNAALFLLRLVNREPDITVHRLVRLPRLPGAETLASYDHVITFEQDLRAAAARRQRVRPAGWIEGWDD